MENFPENFDKGKEEAGEENGGLILENGIWRKRTKEDDIELTKQTEEPIKEKNEGSEEGKKGGQIEKIKIVLKITEKKGKPSSILKDIPVEKLKEWNKPETEKPKEKKGKAGKKENKQPEKKEKKIEEQKEESPEKQLDKIMKEIKEGNISPDKFLKFISTPGADESISKIFNNPEFQEEIKKLEARDKIKEIIDKFQKFINKEKELPKPEAVTKAKKFIKEQLKMEQKSKKESPWKTGFGTTGGAIAFFLFLFILVVSKGMDYLPGMAGDKKKK
jgi:hypothetical protein